MIPDDPIIQHIYLFGYPPWFTDGGYETDEVEEEECDACWL